MASNLFVLTLDVLLKLNTKYYNLILILHMPTVVLGVYYSASFWKDEFCLNLHTQGVKKFISQHHSS